MDKKKILLVDDEKDLVKGVQIILEAHGYDVLTAFDGQEALERAKVERPDLIILDLMLPKMDGYKVCALLKNDARYSKMPIILFTARVEDEDKKLAAEVRADAYITKPFKQAELLDTMKRLLK